MIIQDAISEFKRLHGGRPPVEVVIDPAAALIIAAQERLPATHDGVPVRVAETTELSRVEDGSRVALVTAKLPGDRVGVVATGAR